jgi:hypothetical protein
MYPGWNTRKVNPKNLRKVKKPVSNPVRGYLPPYVPDNAGATLKLGGTINNKKLLNYGANNFRNIKEN